MNNNLLRSGFFPIARQYRLAFSFASTKDLSVESSAVKNAAWIDAKQGLFP